MQTIILLNIRKVFLIFLFLGISLNSYKAYSQCSEIMKYGLYEIQTITDKTLQKEYLKTWFKSTKFQSIDEIRNVGGSLGLDIPDAIGLSGSYNNNQSKIADYQASLESNLDFQKSIETFFNSTTFTITDKLNEVLLACVNQKGLRISVKEEQGNMVKFSIKYAAYGTEKVKIKKFAYVGATNETKNIRKGLKLKNNESKEDVLKLTGDASFTVDANQEIIWETKSFVKYETTPIISQKGYKEEIINGRTIYVLFNGSDCPSDEGWSGDSDPLGTLKCGEYYKVRYEKLNKCWSTEGYNEAQGKHWVIDGLRCTRTPDNYELNLWGATFKFNDNGEVFYDSLKVGEINF